MKKNCKLRDNVKSLCSEEVIAEAELSEMTNNLIKFFALGVSIMNQAENDCINLDKKKEENNDLCLSKK